jgi:copper transporter 1
MLWNWYTIDSCFIASTWHIRTSGMFAGSCIGVILLTMSLEFMRRLVKEYDVYLARTHAARIRAIAGSENGDDSPKDGSSVPATTAMSTGYRPNLFEQAIRAFLHMVQFAVAYFIMLYVFSDVLLPQNVSIPVRQFV